MTQDAFEARVTALTDTLYRVCATLLPRLCDRQDAVQSAVLKAWQHRDRVRGDEMFRPWLIRIAINECYTLLRRQRRMVLMAEMPETEAPPPNGRDEALHAAVQALPEKQRLAVVLHYREGMQVADIARALRLPQGTVKSRLHAARTTLRKTLREEVDL